MRRLEVAEETPQRTRRDRGGDPTWRHNDLTILSTIAVSQRRSSPRSARAPRPGRSRGSRGESYRPENLATGRAYAGGNSLYLAVRGDQRGFGDNRWATYRQIQSAGGQVRKGECGEKVLFFDNTRKIPVKDSKGCPKKDAEGHQVYQIARREISLFRQYTVFNVEQADDLQLERPTGNKAPLWQVHQDAEAVIEESKVACPPRRGRPRLLLAQQGRDRASGAGAVSFGEPLLPDRPA